MTVRFLCRPGELAEEVNRGQMMFRGERDNSGGVETGQRIAKDNHGIGALGGGRGKGGQETEKNPRHAAPVNYVDMILKGAKPGDLPIQQPAKLELAVNPKPPR